MVADETLTPEEAERRNVSVIGTLRVLRNAARANLLALPDALSKLEQTNFYVASELIRSLLEKDLLQHGEATLGRRSEPWSHLPFSECAALITDSERCSRSGLWLTSTFLPCAQVMEASRYATRSVEVMHGFRLAALGWMGPLALSCAWYAHVRFFYSTSHGSCVKGGHRDAP